MNNIQTTINVNGNNDAVNGSLGLSKGNLGAIKEHKFGVIIGKLIFFLQKQQFFFFSIMPLLQKKVIFNNILKLKQKKTQSPLPSNYEDKKLCMLHRLRPFKG